TGIAIDPTNVSNIWISDSGTDRVYQYNAAATRVSGSQSAALSFALATANGNAQGIADPPAPTTSVAASTAIGSIALSFDDLLSHTDKPTGGNHSLLTSDKQFTTSVVAPSPLVQSLMADLRPARDQVFDQMQVDALDHVTLRTRDLRDEFE